MKIERFHNIRPKLGMTFYSRSITIRCFSFGLFILFWHK